jgi:Transglycosylase SLT domain
VRRVSKESGVPIDILSAVALTETGMHKSGHFFPYPWSANVEGKGFRFQNKADAVLSAQSWLKQGITSFDTGCMQLNWRWHGKSFRDVNHIFEPYANVRYAANYLKSHYVALGSWAAAVGRYHSGTEQYASVYRRKVAANRNLAVKALKVPAVTLASLTFPSDFTNGIASAGKSTPLPPSMNVRGELSGPITDPYKNVDRELLQNNLYYKGYSPVGNSGLPQSALEIDPAKVRAMRDGGAIVPGATAESEEEPEPGAITVFADMNKPLLTLPSAPTSLISEESGSLYAPVQRHNAE